MEATPDSLSLAEPSTFGSTVSIETYTKGKVIVSKYVLYFIIYVICCIAYLLEMQVVPELKLENFAQTAALVFFIQAFGMGIFLPIQYKFGYEYILL